MRVTKALMWVLGTGFLSVLLFALSFYGVLKLQMRSTIVVVPDLAGKTPEQAAAIARPVGLVVEVVDQRHDASVPSGQVLQQEPEAGSSVRRGRRIKVVTSLGDRILEVPEIVGQGSRSVEIELRRQGFSPGTEARTFSDQAAASTVLAQVPPAGSPAVPASRVHRLVSDGPLPRQWVMPDLSGRPRQAVERWIDLCGFRRGPVRLVEVSEGKSGTIVGQLPLAGYPVATRGVVELTVVR